MKKIIKKLISKNIIKILNIYMEDMEKEVLPRGNYLNDTIYNEIKYLLRLIKEREKENGRRNNFK